MVGKIFVIEREHIQTLLSSLTRHGYELLGPTVRDGAIQYSEITSVEQLPLGWTDEQEGGTYRLRKTGGQALFGYGVGPHSWKQFLHPPTVRLWGGERRRGEVQISGEEYSGKPKAFVGVRSCELNAISIQDKVFLGGAYEDRAYRLRRNALFIIAVNCGHAGGTCFCSSMNTGPKATGGFDLALTEIIEDGRHYFVTEVGTERGSEILLSIPHGDAGKEESTKAENVVAATKSRMGRTLDTSDIKNLLYNSYEHPRWNDPASRCLSCANCTMVCPTCFCTTVEDLTDLAGSHIERVRKWDSCFTVDFSYIHGGSVRSSVKARYRQWMVHKLASWIDQFETSGCVGCGRCITWCPVGIDITEEVKAIRETGQPSKTSHEVHNNGNS